MYVLIVVFAVIRVITALFLQKTMEAAKGDEEMMIMQKLKSQEEYIKRIQHFLDEADNDGNGVMDKDELNGFMSHPHFQKALHGLGLEQHEVSAIFAVLNDGNSPGVSHDEFIGGCMRLAGGARAIDSVLIMHEQTKISNKVDGIYDLVVSHWGLPTAARAPVRKVGMGSTNGSPQSDVVARVTVRESSALASAAC